jgi:hypothetical protein
MMNNKEISKQLGIGINLFNQFLSSMNTLWCVVHTLDKMTLIRILIKHYHLERDELYEFCNDEIELIKQMYVRVAFVNTMDDLGMMDSDAGSRKVYKFIDYWLD